MKNAPSTKFGPYHFCIVKMYSNLAIIAMLTLESLEQKSR